MNKVILISLLLLLQIACGPKTTNLNPSPEAQPEQSPQETKVQGNNSAILEGENMGIDNLDLSLLRKEVSVTLVNSYEAFELGKAFIARSRADSQTIYWFVEVTNVSSQLHCFVKASDIEFQDQKDNLLTEDNLSFARGSVGEGFTVYTPTCLQPEESSFFSGIELSEDGQQLYTDTETIRITRLDSNTNMALASQEVLPQSYSVDATSFLRPLTLTIKNTGSEIAKVISYARMILLDAQGDPLIWTFISNVADISLAVNKTTTMTGSASYSAEAKRMKAWIDFDAPDSTSLTIQANLSDAERLELREQLEFLKEQQFRAYLGAE